MNLPLLRCALLISCLASLVPVHGAPAATVAAPAPRVRIVLVGDSTVTDHAGWGLGFRQFVDESRVELINTSQGGRSSMSFIKEGRWEKALALRGDYYLIQFGHNDEPGKPGRSTTVEEFRDYLNRYVDEARAAGAKPVLVTCLTRRQFDKADDHKINSSLVPRVAIIKDIAAAKHVPLVDLHERSKALCERLGREGCLVFSPSKVVDGKTVPDGTHLNPKGSVMFARLVVEELRAAVPELAPVLRAEPLNVDPRPGEKPFILLRGAAEKSAATVISLGTNLKSMGADGKKIGTPESATVLVRAADFTAENITFENTTTRDDHVQALAFYVTGARAVLRRCRLVSSSSTAASRPRQR
jgi:pectinesterase